jgi:hypothetical protein
LYFVQQSVIWLAHLLKILHKVQQFRLCPTLPVLSLLVSPVSALILTILAALAAPGVTHSAIHPRRHTFRNPPPPPRSPAATHSAIHPRRHAPPQSHIPQSTHPANHATPPHPPQSTPPAVTPLASPAPRTTHSPADRRSALSTLIQALWLDYSSGHRWFSILSVDINRVSGLRVAPLKPPNRQVPPGSDTMDVTSCMKIKTGIGEVYI